MPAKKNSGIGTGSLDSKDLGWLLILARLEHVGETATRLGVSQSTVSRSLARVEQHLGAELFDRQGKRLRLNQYGQIFCDHASRVLEELATAQTLIAELMDPTGRAISLGYQSWLGSWLVPELIGRFRRQVPGIRFSLRAAPRTQLQEHLERGEMDLILTAFPPPAPARWEVIFSEDLFIAVHPTHRLANRREVSLVEMEKEEFLLPISGLRQLIDGLFRQAGFTPQLAAESYELSTLRGLVAANLGVAVLHSDHARERSDVVYVPLSDSGSRSDVGIGWMENRPEDPGVSRFRQSVLARSTSMLHSFPIQQSMS